MFDRGQVAESKAIQKRTGKTFHFATRVLPKRVRWPTYVLYAFFRVADEVVDDARGVPPERQRARLERLRAEALCEVEATSPVLDAFQTVKREHGLADADIDSFIDAMKTDITKERYATYAELEAYVRGSSVAVGNMMTAVMGPDEPERALPAAKAMAQAFQLTNFLRDVREDVVERDRIYLPESVLTEHGVTTEQIESLAMSDEFRGMMEAQLRWTETLYRRGVAGVRHLPRDCRLAVLAAAVLYADHHRLIRNAGYDVLSNDLELGTGRKLRLLAETGLHWLRTGDPETVFERVSAVAPPEPVYERVDSPEKAPVGSF